MADDAQQQDAGGEQQLAHFRYGVYANPGPYVGRTVAEVRQQLGRLWQVPGDAQAYIGKNKLDDNYVVKAGDNIEFHRRQGEKG